MAKNALMVLFPKKIKAFTDIKIMFPFYTNFFDAACMVFSDILRQGEKI